MASGITQYLGGKVIDHILRNQAFTPPATVYLGLYTVAPTNAGGGTEVTGGSYARQAVTLTAASLALSHNSGAVTFPTATADWGTVVAVGLFDAVSAGNLLWWGNLTANHSVPNGVTFSFADSAFNLDLDN